MDGREAAPEDYIGSSFSKMNCNSGAEAAVRGRDAAPDAA
jgi:hypothetical protein